MAESNKLVEKLTKWAHDYPSYLSTRTDYGRGYKEGVLVCKDIVKEILNECGFGTIVVDKTDINQ